jgi:hypothetical protein
MAAILAIRCEPVIFAVPPRETQSKNPSGVIRDEAVWSEDSAGSSECVVADVFMGTEESV